MQLTLWWRHLRELSTVHNSNWNDSLILLLRKQFAFPFIELLQSTFLFSVINTYTIIEHCCCFSCTIQYTYHISYKLPKINYLLVAQILKNTQNITSKITNPTNLDAKLIYDNNYPYIIYIYIKNVTITKHIYAHLSVSCSSYLLHCIHISYISIKLFICNNFI